MLLVAIYLLARLHWRLQFSAMGSFGLFSVFVLLLAAQPDLSQALAFTLAAIFIVWHRADSLVLKVVGGAVLGGVVIGVGNKSIHSASALRRRRDPTCSASAGDFAMIAAIFSVALLP